MVLDKTLESPLDCKEMKPVSPKRNQSWIFFGRTDDEAEAPIHWPPDAKSLLIRKDPDAREDWRPGVEGETEIKMVRWYHQLDGDEFKQASRNGEEYRSLACQSVRSYGGGCNWATEQQYTKMLLSEEASSKERNSMCLRRWPLQGQPYLGPLDCMSSVDVYPGRRAFLHLS